MQLTNATFWLAQQPVQAQAALFLHAGSVQPGVPSHAVSLSLEQFCAVGRTWPTHEPHFDPLLVASHVL
jgi:hypothetical protein